MGGAARCPLNRSSTTSTPPSRNYESLRAGFHRGNTHTYTRPGDRTARFRRPFASPKLRGVIYGGRELRLGQVSRAVDSDSFRDNDGTIKITVAAASESLCEVVVVVSASLYVFVKLVCRPRDVLKRVLSVGAERSGMERRFRLTAARNPATL